jgi:hypothetical protein
MPGSAARNRCVDERLVNRLVIETLALSEAELRAENRALRVEVEALREDVQAYRELSQTAIHQLAAKTNSVNSLVALSRSQRAVIRDYIGVQP